MLLEMAFPAPSSGEMIQISVSYSWPIYQSVPTLLQCNSDYKLLFDCGTGASRFMFNINHIGDRIGVGALPATAICVLFERL